MRSRWMFVVGAAVLLSGCGDRHLVLNVDVLSYLDPNVTKVAFGPVPAIPGGIYTGEQELVKDAQVNMLEGTSDVADVQSVSIALTVIATDSTGAGEDTLRLYLSGDEAEPLSTPPVLTIPVVFTDGLTDTVHVESAGDERVADLFANRRMRVTLTTALRGPASGPSLNGKLEVAALDATLIAGRKGGL